MHLWVPGLSIISTTETSLSGMEGLLTALGSYEMYHKAVAATAKSEGGVSGTPLPPSNPL